MKHTNGNWKHSQEVKSYYSSLTGVPKKEVSNWIRDDKENAIAVTMDHRHTEEENAANAKLMAAAPELLEALLKIANYDTSQTNYSEDKLQRIAVDVVNKTGVA